jgi:general secretion pathway protein G
MKKTRFKSADGFTLIELIVVMSILVVLAGMSLVQHQNAVKRTQEAALKEDLFRMRDAIDQYYADRNKYPGTLQDLVSEHYLRTIPKDPFTDSVETWQTIPAEPDPSNPSGDIGIYDVKSGSQASGLDGTKYSDW